VDVSENKLWGGAGYAFLVVQIDITLSANSTNSVMDPEHEQTHAS